MDGHHLRNGIDVQAVAVGIAFAQGVGDGDSQLLQQRVQNRKARHQFGARTVAPIDFAGCRFVNGLAQVHLQDLRPSRMLPLSGGVSWRQADAARSDERRLPRGAFNLAGHLSRPAQMIDQRRMPNGPFDGLERGFL